MQDVWGGGAGTQECWIGVVRLMGFILRDCRKEYLSAVWLNYTNFKRPGLPSCSQTGDPNPGDLHERQLRRLTYEGSPPPHKTPSPWPPRWDPRPPQQPAVWSNSKDEFHETCHSVSCYFIKRHSKRCCDTTTPKSIHTKDESKHGSAFAFIFGVNWPVQWM